MVLTPSHPLHPAYVGFEVIPITLRVRDQFVVWRYEKRGGQQTKVPYNPKSMRRARVSEASTWGTYEEALACYSEHGDTLDGIGYVFTEDDPFAGVDLDKCIDDDGQIVPAAQEVIDLLASYGEISPSNTGVKIIIEASKPEGARCKSKAIAGIKEIEIYDAGRFFTFTGRHLPGTPMTVEPRQAELEALCARLWPPKPKRERQATSGASAFEGDDEALIRRACEAKHGDTFRRLLAGDTSGHGDDQSAADLALCNHLAFWTGRDADRIDRLFRGSGLMRDKWDEKRGDRTYGEMTVAKAIEDCSEVYSPRRRRTHMNGSTPPPETPPPDEPAADSPPPTTEQATEAKPLALPDTTRASIARLTTDVGNAARLLVRYGERIRYCYGPGNWLIWDGKRWRIDDRGQITKFCTKTALAILDECKREQDARQKELLDWARASQRRERIAAMAALAQPDVAVGPDDLDADRWAFNCLNGTIELTTGELRPHCQEDLITKLAPVEYDPEAKCPRFMRFLNEIFGGDQDLIRFVQRWHGYCLSGDIREQYLPIYCGEGNNGKSVLLDTICAIMGGYAGEAPPDLLTVRKHAEHPTEIADLHGKRLVIASETERDAELRLQLVKRLTGNARLKARLMRQDYFEFDRTHKMVLVTNNKPTIKENTEAAWRRLRLVPFSIIIPEHKRDTDLLRKLEGEHEGILAWMVQGCVDWLREGLTTPGVVVLATEEYRGTANSLAAFLRERCTLGAGLVCRTSELVAAYGEWCVNHSRVSLRGKALADALEGKECESRKLKGHWHWVGLALQERH